MMTGPQKFYPPQNPGLALHIIVILLIMGGITALLVLAFSQPPGFLLILMILGLLALVALLPLAAYRGYALVRAGYELDRDGLRVSWGLRQEDIPMSEVIWVRQAAEVDPQMRLPVFSATGAILGNAMHADLGSLEFLASSAQDLVIVSTINKTLVLSPEDPVEFDRIFQRFIEMGSLTPIEPFTAQPAAFFREVWANRFARTLVTIYAGLSLLLLVLTGVLIPLREAVSLGFDLNGIPLEAVPSGRLLLLPVLCMLFTLSGLIMGFFFYRKPENRAIPFFIWTAGILTSFLFIVATLVLFFTAQV